MFEELQWVEHYLAISLCSDALIDLKSVAFCLFDCLIVCLFVCLFVIFPSLLDVSGEITVKNHFRNTVISTAGAPNRFEDLRSTRVWFKD